MKENWSCGGSGPHQTGDVRSLPLGGGSNLILCQFCWNRELVYRRERNESLDKSARFETPDWQDGTLYETDAIAQAKGESK